MKKKKKQIKKKLKIKYSRVFLFLFIIILIIISLFKLFNLKITNIYIINNSFLTDQEVIDIAGISDYPKTFFYSKNKIKSKLKDNVFINNVKVTKKKLTEVYIEVEENSPLFYYTNEQKTILKDGSKVEKTAGLPIVLNYIPNLKYEDFIKKMSLLDSNILSRISEIKYDPSDYDDERFLLYMNDGNYVYINLYKFENLNKYIEIVKNLGNKRGIVYLDSGNYFEIIEN